MKSYRKFILGFLILISAGLSFYYVSLVIKTPQIPNIIITLALLFLFSIFNSILFASSRFYYSISVHILTAVAIVLIFNSLLLNLSTAILIAFVYLIFQIYAYSIIFYFEKERLRINWVGIFKGVWYCLSWFLIFVIAVVFMTKFEAQIFKNGFMKNFIIKLEPLFIKLKLPSPNIKIQELIESQIPQEQTQQLNQFQGISQIQNLLQMQGLNQFSGMKLNIPNSKEITQMNLNQLNKQFSMKLKGDETVADFAVMYIKKLWSELNDNMKFVIKLIIVVLIASAFQPVFWILGNVLSFVALPLFILLGKFQLYSKETEQVAKEKIVL